MEPILDQVETPIDIKKYRRDLLPWWIKFFCWFFMVVGGLIVLGLLSSPFLSNTLEVNAFGFEVTTLKSTEGVILLLVMLLSMMVGYGLYYGKNWGVKLGIALSVINIVLFFGVFSIKGKIRFEYIPVFPFFFKLMNLNLVWQGPKNNTL